MRIAHDVLRRYIDVPSDVRELRALLDDCGLEVKRVEHDGTDSVFTLELLANRGDHHCYEGVATELNGRLGTGVTSVHAASLETGESPWGLVCETDLCPVYTATLFEKHRDGGLSAPDLRTLEAAGIHSLSAPVDATNLVNLEIGQPTHAFDADTLDGPIAIRLSRAGERAWPLFRDEKVELPEGTLVIADNSKILAIAGVIGCEESKTTEHTTRLILESAHFDPIAVRKASRALDIHTDSSARFERGSDPARPLAGAARVAELLQGAGWSQVGRTGTVGDWQDPNRMIQMDLGLASRFLGISLDSSQAADILARFGFDFGTSAGSKLVVRVPTHRLWDVEFAADLYEELAKAIGYNNTPIALPPVDLGALPAEWEIRKRKAEDTLIGNGFYEVFTDGFYGRHMRDQLGLHERHKLWNHVETTNAIERNYAFLKNNALGQALDCVAANARMRNPSVRAYEWTRTFHPNDEDGVPGPGGQGRSPCVERRVLWAIASGTDRPRSWAGGERPADVWFLKGVVEELGLELGLDLTIGGDGSQDPVWDRLHPGRRAGIFCGLDMVGLIGEVHPGLIKAWKLKKARPTFVRLDADVLLHRASTHRGFAEPPDWHPIERSLAFGIPEDFEAGSIAAFLRAHGPTWLNEVVISDRFETDGVVAITYALTFDNDPADRRSAESVNEVCEALVEGVHTAFRGSGIRQR